MQSMENSINLIFLMERNTLSEAEILRQKAEKLLKKRPYGSGSLESESEMMKLIQELEVHQIELEMQNEELMMAKAQIELDSINQIAERSLAVEVLREKNSNLEFAMQAANMAWWKMDVTTGNVTFEI